MDSSTHEQLHYSIPATPTTDIPTDERWNKRESPHQDHTSDLSNAFPDSETAGRESEELSGVRGDLPAFENGGHVVSVVTSPCMSAVTSPRPTPPTSFQEQKMESEKQEFVQNALERGPHFLKWESERKAMYKHCSLDPKYQNENLGRVASEPQDNLTIAPSVSDDALCQKSPKLRSSLGDYDEDEWEEIVVVGQHNQYSHSSGGEGIRGSFDLDEESSLDLLNNRKRSSPLVGYKEHHDRRVLVETREHNLLPPSPPALDHQTETELLDPISQDCGSVVFTASGFSRLSPNNDTSAMTSTSAEVIQDHSKPDMQSLELSGANNVNVRGHGAKNNVVKGHESQDNNDNMVRGQTKQSTRSTNFQAGSYSASESSISSNSQQAPLQEQPMSSSSRVLDDHVKVLELSNLPSSSHLQFPHSLPQLQLSSHPRPRANNYKQHIPSSMVHGNLPPPSSSPITASPPPPALAPSPSLIRPQVSTFQRPRGYALKSVGVATPHVVGMRGREEESMPASTLVTEEVGSSTGNTQQGVGGTGRDDQFLEDWIDGF